MLNANSAMARAQKSGVPVFTIAQGEALRSRQLMLQLKKMAEDTGAEAFSANRASEIDRIFSEISERLKHVYLLAYNPGPVADRKWHTIRVSVDGMSDARVRAKDGYFPD
jgi:hypothetical protein